MSEYRYLVADLLTDTVREEMPFQNVTYGDVLNAPGAFSGTLPLSVKNASGFEKVTRANLDPGRTAIYVERDDVLVWGGILWTCAADDSNFTLKVGAEGFWSYFRRRIVRALKNYANADQLFMARDLVNYAQGILGGSLGVVVGSELSGVFRNKTFNAWDLANLAQAVEELAALDNGFDFAVTADYVAGVRTKTLRLYYPRRGARLPHVLDLGSNIEALSWNLDATAQANLIVSVGAGDGPSMLTATAADTASLTSYPLLEETTSHKDVMLPDTLAAISRSDLMSRKKTIESLPTLVAHGTSDLAIGSFGVGDEIEARTQNAGGFLSIDTIFRILAWTVAVSDEGKETITFSLSDTEALVTNGIFNPKDAHARIDKIEKRLHVSDTAQRSNYASVGAASEPSTDTISSATYTDATHVGPAVTVNAWGQGGGILIVLGADLAPGVGSIACASFEIKDQTGAIVQAPSDAQGVTCDLAGQTNHFVRNFKITGLPPGTYTVMMKYRVNGSVCGVSKRDLVVFPL